MSLKKNAIDPRDVPVRTGSTYPPEFAGDVAGRKKRALGDAAGLTQYGVNLVELPAGAMSSQRHWHSHEDEFIYVVEGELVLVTDEGEQRLTAGMAAGFPAGSGNGHHTINRSDRPAKYLEVGTRHPDDSVVYPDIDLHLPNTQSKKFTRKNGKPYLNGK